MRYSTKFEMLQHIINTFPENQLFTPAEVYHLGHSRSLIGKNLKELSEVGIIEHHHRGVYVMRNRSDAINFLVEQTTRSPSSRNLDLSGLNLFNRELIEQLEDIQRLVIAIRSLNIPGANHLASYYAGLIRDDRQLLKLLITSISKVRISEQEALKILQKHRLDLHDLALRFEPHLSVDAARFVEIVTRHEAALAG